MVDWLREVLSFLTLEMAVMFTAAVPLIEVRGAIPVGIALGLSPLHATIISFIGGSLPVPLILFGIRPVFNYLRHLPAMERWIEKISHKTVGKTEHKVQKYGAWALLVFVAIPLPGTGVWTGSLAAALLDIRFKWAFPAIVVGNAIASILIATLSYGFVSLIG